jgi:hypothetical protein
MRHAHVITILAMVGALSAYGCRDTQQVGEASAGGTPRRHAAERTLPPGTSLDVTLGTPLTSETARVGDRWTGTIRNATVVQGREIVPAGSSVSGTVAAVTPAHKGDRALLDLRLDSVTIDGRDHRVHGGMAAIVAGSTRARNLGAIGAATVAGAVVGHQVGNSDKGTLIGGLLGAGAATGVVSQTKGWQVVLKSGTPLTFTTDQAVAVRL